MRTSRKAILLGVFLVVSGLGLLAWRGVTITVHAAVPSDIDHELTETLHSVGREMARQSTWLRILAKPVPTMTDALDALASKKSEIALLRSDQPMPAGTSVVAILRKEQVFLLAPGGSKLESFSGLKNERIGILSSRPQDAEVLDRILRFYNLDPSQVGRTSLRPIDVAPAIQEKRITAIFVIGEAGKASSATVFGALARVKKAVPVVVGIEEDDALEAAAPYLVSSAIPQGAFRGAAPEEEVKAPSLEYRLVVQDDVSNLVAGELARILMSTKARLVNDAGVSSISAPDTEDVKFPIHPGARAYFDGDPPSLLSSFETYFWVGWAAVGLIGSIVTWLIGRLQGSRDAEMKDFRHLLLLLSAVRTADRDVLETIRDDFEETVERLLKQSESADVRPEDMSRLQLALNLVRDAIASRAERDALRKRTEQLQYGQLSSRDSLETARVPGGDANA